MRFDLGRVVATPGALGALEEAKQSPLHFLAKHAVGGWGDVCPEDAEANEDALRDGTRLLSSYRTANDERLWIITEADR